MKLHNWWWSPLLQVPMYLVWALRTNWTPRFPRAWRGRCVSVTSLSGQVSKDKMAAIRSDKFELQSSPYPGSMHVFYFKDEGSTWCFGHEGEAVDALVTASALREPSRAGLCGAQYIKHGSVFCERPCFHVGKHDGAGFIW